MNYQQWFVTLASIVADLLGSFGQQALGRVFRQLARLAEAGANVEAHMALIKAKLEAGPITETDWDKVESDIDEAQIRIDNG